MTTGEVIALIKAYGGGGGGSGLPDTPGSNGSYTLMNTVASGTPAVAWVKPLVVTAYDTMSSTFKEIRDAFRSGRHVYITQGIMGDLYANIVSVYEYDEGNPIYRVMFHGMDGSIVKYAATSLNGYPALET